MRWVPVLEHSVEQNRYLQGLSAMIYRTAAFARDTLGVGSALPLRPACLEIKMGLSLPIVQRARRVSLLSLHRAGTGANAPRWSLATPSLIVSIVHRDRDVGGARQIRSHLSLLDVMTL